MINKALAIILILVCLFLAFELLSGKPQNCNGCTGCGSPKGSAVAGISVQDEFEPPGNSGEFTEAADSGEFRQATNGFESKTALVDTTKETSGINWRMLYWPLGAIGFTILAGFFVRYKPTRAFKTVFLVASAVFLGFYNGACPCPISSMSFAVIGFSGGEINWESTVWFLGLIPVTFLLGQVWCGWVCHLGALQEFVYKRNKLKFLQGEKAQKIMKAMRWFFLSALIFQLLYTQTYIYDEIDPFRIAFNLGYGAGLTGWILLALLLISSIFIYRPFCKAACPIGLVYGWIAKIPGASILGRKETCTGCASCARACDYDAIVRKNGYSVLDNKECIMCGECLDRCNTRDITFFRMGSSNPVVVKLEKSN